MCIRGTRTYKCEIKIGIDFVRECHEIFVLTIHYPDNDFSTDFKFPFHLESIAK